MKSKTSRRAFAKNAGISLIGVSLFPGTINCSYGRQNLNIKKACQAVNTLDLRTSLNPQNYISVSGKVFNTDGVSIRNDAVIEVLSAGTMEKIGKVYVNEKGEYNILSEVPEREPGKLPRFYLRVVSPDNSYVTELITHNFGAYISDKHWTLNKQLGERVFPQQQKFADYTNLIFNLSI